MKFIALNCLLLLVFISCNSVISDHSLIKDWGVVYGKKVYEYELKNKKGMILKLTNFGGIITAIIVPDRNEKMDDVVLGFDNLKQYQEDNPCFGATMGRFANRIRSAEFGIDCRTDHLTKNNGEHFPKA